MKNKNQRPGCPRLLPALGLGALVLGLSACGGNPKASTAEYIGIAAAKEVALNDAGVPAAQADFSSAGLDNKNGTFYYEINFTGNGIQYEYDIDAMTGVVIEGLSSAAGENGAGAEEPGAAGAVSTDEILAAGETGGISAEGQSVSPDGSGETSTRVSADGQSPASQAPGSGQPAAGTDQAPAAAHAGQSQTPAGQSQATAGQPQPAPAGQSQSSASITESQAQSIALSHAGVTETDLVFIEAKRDFDDGQEIFEVEFFTSGGTEYNYDIRVSDGSVIKYDYETKTAQTTPQPGTGMISEDQARQAVLDRVPGAPAAAVSLHLDEDDGRMEYEGELKHDGMKYEFKIDAYSGSILEWEAKKQGR